VPSVALQRHPANGCEAVDAIVVAVEREGAERLALAYTLRGDTSRLRVPAPAVPARRDELWRHTCFELFLRGGGEAYAELNFSPSGDWAAYAFEGYRRGVTTLALPEPPQIEPRRTRSELVVEVRVRLPEPPAGSGSPRVALSAVVEDVAGRLSYWALAHCGERPDFHAPEGFVLALPAPAGDLCNESRSREHR
jgi:hypothetical protein